VSPERAFAGGAALTLMAAGATTAYASGNTRLGTQFVQTRRAPRWWFLPRSPSRGYGVARRYANANREAWERLHSTAIVLVVAIDQVLTFENRVRKLTGDGELAQARAEFDAV
jgi:hypothetical protein